MNIYYLNKKCPICGGQLVAEIGNLNSMVWCIFIKCNYSIKRKIIEGWLEVQYEDTAVYPKENEGHYPGNNRLNDELEEFDGKKIRITIEEIE